MTVEKQFVNGRILNVDYSQINLATFIIIYVPYTSYQQRFLRTSFFVNNLYLHIVHMYDEKMCNLVKWAVFLGYHVIVICSIIVLNFSAAGLLLFSKYISTNLLSLHL